LLKKRIYIVPSLFVEKRILQKSRESTNHCLGACGEGCVRRITAAWAGLCTTWKEFNFKKGIWVAFFAGIMSASFAYGIAAGKPIAAKAIELGTPKLFSNSPSFIFIMAGGFTVNAIWCFILSFKNKTFRDYIKSKDTPILKNYFFSALAGITWYFQFMFYGMGTTKMGEYDFASWSIHMAFIIVFSTMWGLILKEWKGSSKKTMRIVFLGLGILILSTFIIGAGNYIQTFE